MVISDIYYRKAMFYKRLYEITKLKWAKDKNHYYVNEAYKLLFGGLGVAAFDITILEEYLKSFGE